MPGSEDRPRHFSEAAPLGAGNATTLYSGLPAHFPFTRRRTRVSLERRLAEGRAAFSQSSLSFIAGIRGRKKIIASISRISLASLFSIFFIFILDFTSDGFGCKRLRLTGECPLQK